MEFNSPLLLESTWMHNNTFQLNVDFRKKNLSTSLLTTNDKSFNLPEPILYFLSILPPASLYTGNLSIFINYI